MSEAAKIWIETYKRLYTHGNHDIANSAANAAVYRYLSLKRN